MDGKIDEIRIYSRALSPDEIGSLYRYESQSQVTLVKAIKPSFSRLIIGRNYILQVSSDLIIWTNQGKMFTATDTSMEVLRLKQITGLAEAFKDKEFSKSWE